MTLLSLEKIVGCDNYYIDDKTLNIYSFKKNNKNGKLMKGSYNKGGYIQYCFYANGKSKTMLLHTIIVKMFIKTDYDSNKEEIDHMDHNRTNNCIDNLCVVSKSENHRNRSSMNGKLFNFVDNIGRSLIINKEAGIYYSLEYDKFYMFINQTKKYKELHEHIHHGCPVINYKYNNKNYEINTIKFRNNLNKK